MIAFVIRRLIATVFVMFAISVLVFLIFFATPGVDPAARIAGRNADQQTLQQVRHDFGLDRPLPVQYAIMMKKLFITPRPDVVRQPRREGRSRRSTHAAPVTLSLVFGAAVIWVVVAIAMGLAAAVIRGTFVDPLLMILGLIGISMPVFWLGEVVNLITQSRLHDELFSWVPPLGYTPFTADPVAAGSSTCSSRGSRSRCSTSASTGACCARA